MAPQIEPAQPGRHPGDGAHRLHPAERARPRRLPRAGPRRRRRAGPRRRPRRPGRRRVRGRDGDGARRRRRPGHQGARRSRPSASAPASSATARCWSGRTPSVCAPAGWPASSSSTPTSTASCSRAAQAYDADVKGRHLPRARAHASDADRRAVRPRRLGCGMRRMVLASLPLAVAGGLTACSRLRGRPPASVRRAPDRGFPALRVSHRRRRARPSVGRQADRPRPAAGHRARPGPPVARRRTAATHRRLPQQPGLGVGRDGPARRWRSTRRSRRTTASTCARAGPCATAATTSTSPRGG